MSDLISRHGVSAWLDNLGYSKLSDYVMDEDRFPSSEPERKKGKWIVTSEFEDCRYVKCNQCKVTQVFYYNKPLTNFCPNCGSYMRGEQDD